MGSLSEHPMLIAAFTFFLGLISAVFAARLKERFDKRSKISEANQNYIMKLRHLRNEVDVNILELRGKLLHNLFNFATVDAYGPLVVMRSGIKYPSKHTDYYQIFSKDLEQSRLPVGVINMMRDFYKYYDSFTIQDDDVNRPEMVTAQILFVNMREALIIGHELVAQLEWCIRSVEAPSETEKYQLKEFAGRYEGTVPVPWWKPISQVDTDLEEQWQNFWKAKKRWSETGAAYRGK